MFSFQRWAKVGLICQGQNFWLKNIVRPTLKFVLDRIYEHSEKCIVARYKMKKYQKTDICHIKVSIFTPQHVVTPGYT